jgi:hypothetical protein
VAAWKALRAAVSSRDAQATLICIRRSARQRAGRLAR